MNQETSLRQVQEQVDEWIRTVGVRYYSELTNMAILTEEVGEVARLMARLYGDQSFKKSDEAWVSSTMRCSTLGVTAKDSLTLATPCRAAWSSLY